MTVLVVASMDFVARQSLAASLLLDAPDIAVLTHDVSTGETNAVRRMISDRDGLRYDDRHELDHACLACAVREDLIPTLRQLAEEGRYAAVVVALPVSADPRLVMAALDAADRTGEAGPIRPAGVVTLVDPHRLVADLFGSDLLVERGLALGGHDRRAVGEALARQIEAADLIALTGPAADLIAGPPDAPAGQPQSLIQRLAPGVPTRPWADLCTAEVLGGRWSRTRMAERVDPLEVAARSPLPDSDGVWTLDLVSRRAFHPDRLLDCLDDLGRGRFRARGHFWLPTRPGWVCGWDGSGGQLSIGTLGRWRRRPSTRLRVVGIDPADRERLQNAFAAALATPAELAQPSVWSGRGDDFGPWLDVSEEAA